MMVFLQTRLVTNHLAVKFVHQFIDGGIQISVRTLGKHVGALDVDIALRSLPALFLLLLFHREQHLDINHLVEMPDDTIKLAGDITAQ